MHFNLFRLLVWFTDVVQKQCSVSLECLLKGSTKLQFHREDAFVGDCTISDVDCPNEHIMSHEKNSDNPCWQIRFVHLMLRHGTCHDR